MGSLNGGPGVGLGVERREQPCGEEGRAWMGEKKNRLAAPVPPLRVGDTVPGAHEI